MPKKTKPPTVRDIAKRLGMSTANVYKIVRVARKREADPLRPLFDLAEKNHIARSIATNVITVFRHGGLPAIRALLKTEIYRETERGRFIRSLLTSADEDVLAAIAASEKQRRKISSGVPAGMSKTKV